MKNSWKRIFVGACAVCVAIAGAAQSMLYPRLFDLQDVTLGEGPMRQAMLLNNDVLLAYDADRLLTPYFRQAGIAGWEAQHSNFTNWGSGSFRLDGHVGGHYLSALALAYAANDDAAIKARLKERMDYFVDKLAECQAVFDGNTEGLEGYIGGLPDNTVWTRMSNGNLSGYNNNRGNVPFYTMHKVFAGLRDAYVYGGNQKAFDCLVKLCDWGINVVAKLSDSQMQDVLNTEHGGINEVYADMYALTGQQKYLDAARKYSHKTMVDNMQTLNKTFLDGKHANTQVPKYLGFERIAQVDKSAEAYRKAAVNFWHDVVDNRTVALGGNSVDEHFLSVANCYRHIHNTDGPESCNTNNMLKLSEALFADAQLGCYADYCEIALTNHILSTQNPNTGGYVYFTSLRPQHFRIYSQVNQAMWCCVGTGMENHSKYGHFVYSHSAENDTLYVNLFVPSTLDSNAFKIEQATTFPYEPGTKLTMGTAGSYKLAVRHPAWCKGAYAIKVNGQAVADDSAPGEYAVLSRNWKAGDVVTVEMPMQMEMLECPNYPSYVAFRYGPVLLAAITSTEGLAVQFAGEGRMDHSPGQGVQLSLTSAPLLIGNRQEVLGHIHPSDLSQLKFKIDAELYNRQQFAELELQPFFTVHEARYMMYWNQVSAEEWDAIRDVVETEEAQAQYLNSCTLDYVATGEQQSDAGHGLVGDFGKGVYEGESYVDAKAGKEFSYQLATKGEREGLSLMCRYHSADNGRAFSIYVNDRKLRTVKLSATEKGFYNEVYPLSPQDVLNAEGELPDSITVSFRATEGTPTCGLYYLRLLKDYQPQGAQAYEFKCAHWESPDAGRVERIAYDRDANAITVYGKPGNNNVALGYRSAFDGMYYINADQKFFTVRGSQLASGSGKAYLWWLNGANHGSQVAPNYTLQLAGGDLAFVWEIDKTGLADNCTGSQYTFSSHGAAMNTCFGLTSTAADGSGVISDIGFYSYSQLVAAYPEAAGVVVDALGVATNDPESVDVYNVAGQKLKSGASSASPLDGLPAGLYLTTSGSLLLTR